MSALFDWFGAKSSRSRADSFAVQHSVEPAISIPRRYADVQADVGISTTYDNSTTLTSPSPPSSRPAYSDSPSSDGSLQPHTPPSDDPLHLLCQVMPTPSSPIDIASPSRNISSSPSSQGNSTAFNHKQGSRRSAMMSGGTAFDMNMGGLRGDSFAGVKPISMISPKRDTADGRPRRESLAGSLVGGMSWGGVSVGSWIRDDIAMAGTSPFAMQSPSYHSSSYLPKLEANFMRDFSCCGGTLPTLHELLQHYEECHAEQTPVQATRVRETTTPNSKAAIAAQAASAVQHQAQRQTAQNSQQPSSILKRSQGDANVGGIHIMRQQQRSQPQPSASTHQNNRTVDEMDGVEDMEMDEDIGPMGNVPVATPSQSQAQPVQPIRHSMFGSRQRPTLDLNAVGMQHSGLRNSQPSTPASARFGYQNNPTVSSVNTPTLSTHSQQQHQHHFSRDSSITPTTAENMADSRFSNVPMNTNSNMHVNVGQSNYPFGYGRNDLGLDLCIDEPAKRLFSPNGGHSNARALQQQFAQFGLGPGQFTPSDELMRAYRQQQMMTTNRGVSMSAAMTMAEEQKPFRCPVIGCEKAYKNQNGLKYHKTHGHQTQQLHDNADGTFSIVNPETSVPYPGTMGMEKEKPYKCDVCGKRYKNLNGLKYHRQHSPLCNPEVKADPPMATAGLADMGVNVAGLPGIGEDGMM